MSDALRAWKDPEYRSSLSEAELAALPGSPVGAVELTDEDLRSLGGASTVTVPITISISFEAGCYTYNSTVCNGSCAVATQGCCGG